MKIRVLTLCKNEEIIIPHFIKYYSAIADEIIIIDGHSEDKTCEIAQALGGKKVVIKTCDYDDGQKADDPLLKRIRNTEWKENAEDFDWIIVCDADEFLYHPDLYNKLLEYKNKGITLPKVRGYEMIGIELPVSNKLITEQINRGWPSEAYSKNIIFNPKEIKEINYDEGSHKCYPYGNKVISEDSLMLLHYRFLEYKYMVSKARWALNRLSKANLKRNWGFHNARNAFAISQEEFISYYNTKAEKII